MGEKKLNIFFQNFINQKPLFVNKKVLQFNYVPEEVVHRDNQIQQVARILAPALRSEKPSNLFIYGKTGTGKTLSIKHTTESMLDVIKDSDVNLKVIYLNCKLKKIADTEYRLMAQLAREFGKTIPPTGLPTEEIYKAFFDAADAEPTIILLILDEIDQLVKKAGDEILYNLTRINSDLKQSQISIIGISNDLVFTDNIDPRIKSSLSEEDLIFPSYNALQLKEILSRRAKKAFLEGVLEEGVLEKCAAYAAREHGDARRALELLRVAGEIAEREGMKTVKIKQIDIAEEKIERDRVQDIVKTQPKQFQATLYSILKVSMNKKGAIFTGDIYDLYKQVCKKAGLRPLTQRRISDIIAELDMLGIINAKVISKGRYGRTREISMAVTPSSESKILKNLQNSLEL